MSFRSQSSASKRRGNLRRGSLDSNKVPSPQNPYSPKLSFVEEMSLIRGSPQSKSSVYSKSARNDSRSGCATNLPPLKDQEELKSMSEQNYLFKSQASYKQIVESERFIRYENVLESFLTNTLASPISDSIEETIAITLKATTVTLWQDIPSLHMLYSKRLNRTCNHSSGLVGYTFFSREIVKVEKASSHSAYKEEDDGLVCPGITPVLLFPLWDADNNVCSVVEVTRKPDQPFFNEEDESFILFFTKRFKVYSSWLFKNTFPHSFIQELTSVMELEQFLLVFTQRVPTFFNCRKAEIWKYDINNKKLQRFDDHRTVILENDAGIVWESLIRETPLNVSINKLLSSFNSAIDGTEDEPVLVIPVIDVKKCLKWAVVLRGKTKDLNVFTTQDEIMLRDVSPYIITALDNAERYTEAGIGQSKSSLEHQCISALDKIATMLSSGHDMNCIIELCIKSMTELVSSDRCYLFQYDKLSNQYVSNNGKTKIRMDKDKGIVGETFNQGKIFNVPDVLTSSNFDMSADWQTGYKTQSLLSVPVINNRKEVVSVLQFLNRRDQKPFSNVDINFVKILSLVAGLLMENDKMYNISTQAKKEVNQFINSSNIIQNNGTIKSVLKDVVHSALETVSGDRATLFIHDKVIGALSTYIVDGGEMPLTVPISHGIAASACKEAKPIYVNDAYHDPRFNKMIDFHTQYKTKSVIAVPIISRFDGVLGVIEVLNKKNGSFTDDDVSILQSFSTLCALSLDLKHLKDITDRGTAQVEMSKWIGEFECDSYTVPMKLQVPEAKKNELVSLNFFAVDWNGIGLFKICFFVFNSFGLLERFKITNELFFTFLYRLRSSYNEPPYHNWIHAIDVLQYVSYQVRATNADHILTQLELLAVCVAAICHDVGHEGFNNAFNINAETPLGILFKDRSVMETYHCAMTFTIINNPECNIFHSLTHKELQIIWKWIIHLILATDMSIHFKLINKAKEVLEQGALNLKEESDRLMAMELIIKVADISNVSRPFELADQWCEVLSEEFWRQGDREKELGLPYSDALTNREVNNKAQGQINFYTFVCLPLYTIIARIFPELKPNLDSLSNNLEQWKKIKAKEDEEKEKMKNNEVKASESQEK